MVILVAKVEIVMQPFLIGGVKVMWQVNTVQRTGKAIFNILETYPNDTDNEYSTLSPSLYVTEKSELNKMLCGHSLSAPFSGGCASGEWPDGFNLAARSMLIKWYKKIIKRILDELAGILFTQLT